MSMIAQRRPNGTPPDKLRAGQYVHTDGQWWIRTPDASPARALTDHWTVTEHTDYTITITPEIADGTHWQGSLERGTWREAKRCDRTAAG